MTAVPQPPAWRADFPALAVPVHGQRLAYLDSASTTLKPQVVIDAVVRVFTHQAGNVHRAVHAPGEAATEAFDAARAAVARFLGGAVDEVVFVRGTTEALNLVAHSWGAHHVGPGDAVVASAAEHHANLVPWQELCAARGAELRLAPVDDRGQVSLAPVLDERVRLVAVSHVSNVLGTVAPIAELAAQAHAVGAVLVVDGAQAVAHLPVDVAALGCDFYAFSGHKLYAPTGTGVLWGRRALLAAMPAWQVGGEMVARVTATGAAFREPPARFEAGTPDIAGVIGLGAAIGYLAGLDRAEVAAHEARLHAALRARLAAIDGVRVIGAPEVGVVAFTLDGVHAHDVATIADAHGVAIRSGHHCAQPLHAQRGLDASARASIALYTDDEDLAALDRALRDVRRVLR